MTARTRTRRITVASAALVLATSPAVALASPPGSVQARAQGEPHVRHVHTVDTIPAVGKFRCGHLRLEVTHGTQTEVFDGLRTRGVTFIQIHRRLDHVKLIGSDGRVYRITGLTRELVTRERVVLVEPDDDNPVWATEIIELRFHNRHVGSPGYLREVIKTRDGVETVVVTGPCDFA